MAAGPRAGLGDLLNAVQQSIVTPLIAVARVIHEAMQPEHVSIWLRSPADGRPPPVEQMPPFA